MVNTSAWAISDRKWFAEHPHRSYRIRCAIPEEPILHGESYDCPLHVIVHRYANELYSGIAFSMCAAIADSDEALASIYQERKSILAIARAQLC